MARKIFIAGNWKMNGTADEAAALARQVVALAGQVTDVDVAVCPPYTNLAAVAAVVQGTTVKLGAQDVYWEENGAYTGKISCGMLKAVGVDYVIIGHSEQRTYFGETDETVNRKVRATLAAGLLPIVCVGETLDERRADRVKQVVETQTRGGLDGLTAGQAARCTIAYEPVWAIGTGETATPEQANDAHRIIREVLAGMFGDDTAQRMRIQYGGSMKPGNAAELLGQSDVDGGLIGGAALKAEDFYGIIHPKDSE